MAKITDRQTFLSAVNHLGRIRDGLKDIEKDTDNLDVSRRIQKQRKSLDSSLDKIRDSIDTDE